MLIAACVIAAVVLVFPLWKFAVAAPKIYTAVVLILLVLFIIFLITRKLINTIKAGKNK
jgi:glycopeptide antibiotics resistance protein